MSVPNQTVNELKCSLLISNNFEGWKVIRTYGKKYSICSLVVYVSSRYKNIYFYYNKVSQTNKS